MKSVWNESENFLFDSFKLVQRIVDVLNVDLNTSNTCKFFNVFYLKPNPILVLINNTFYNTKVTMYVFSMFEHDCNLARKSVFCVIFEWCTMNVNALIICVVEVY